MKRLKTVERVLSKAGVGSRTEARNWVAEGRVRVNGRVIRDVEFWVDLDRDRVEFDRKPLRAAAKTYILLYKPSGYLTTYDDPQGRPTVFDLLTDRKDYLFPVGRLDLETSGLIILTNDTAFAERITNPDFKVPKTYQVKASRHLTDDELERLRSGVELRDGMTAPATLARLREPGGRTVFEITITEGRNRQVRRMVEALDAKVLKLVRTAIGGIRTGDLPIGKYRELTAKEVRSLVG